MSFFRETTTHSSFSESPPPLIKNPSSSPTTDTETKNSDSTHHPQNEEEEDEYPFLTSTGKVFGTFSGVGTSTKRYFRFTNIQLTDNNTLTFFLPPGMTPPKPQIVDIIINNASTKATSLPTVVTVRAGKLQQYQYLNIKYVNAEKNQPKCKKWEKRPVYLLTMQHSENIWHAWADGLLGAFQTLREQGLLPLAEIDDKGNIKEYIDDLREECQKEIQIEDLEESGSNAFNNNTIATDTTKTSMSTSVKKTQCRPRRNIVPHTKCDPSTELWCRPGLIVGTNATAAGGPVLLPYKGTEVVRRWKHLFQALSSEIIRWESSFGTCFSEMYIGKSNVLQFYMPLKMGRENTNLEILQRAKAQRSDSTAAVKAFMLTAERIRRATRHARKPNLRRWAGYSDSTLEKLRLGIGRENIDLVNALRPTKERAKEFGEMNDSEWQELDALLIKSEKLVSKAVEQAQMRKRRKKRQRRLQEENSRGSFVTEKPRPVLTYMWRSTFK